MGSQKHFLFLPPYFEGNIDVTDDILHHYALPNSIDNDTNFEVLQNDSYAYQLKYYSDKEDERVMSQVEERAMVYA